MLTRLWPEDVLCRFVTLPPSLPVVHRKASQQLTLKQLSLKTLARVSTVCHFVTCLQSARILHHRRCPLSHLLEVAICCRGGSEVKNKNKLGLSLFSLRSLLLDLKEADLKRYVAVIARCFPETMPLHSPKCWPSSGKSLFHWRPTTTAPMICPTRILLLVSNSKVLIAVTKQSVSDCTLYNTQVASSSLPTWVWNKLL